MSDLERRQQELEAKIAAIDRLNYVTHDWPDVVERLRDALEAAEWMVEQTTEEGK
jgi:hypothetical protein